MKAFMRKEKIYTVEKPKVLEVPSREWPGKVA